MSISHASIIHKPGDYVAPVDLNLLGKVLQYKQGEYDAGVNKVQNSLDSAASLDVARSQDKDYLNSKLASLVQTVNGMGGADLSDSNTTNAIAGLSSQIHGDTNIINAVAGTKALRYVQNFYKDLKEKKPKEYNPANEDHDMGKFESWFNDQRVGASTQGDAGKVTPYAAYEQDWQKMFDKIANNANVSQEITDKGLMYRLDTHTVVTKEQIYSAASKMLSPAQRQQIAIEGRYQYKNVPPEALAQAFDQKIYDKVQGEKKTLADYAAKAKIAVGVDDQSKYRTLMEQTQNRIDGLLAPVKRNAEQIKEGLYMDEKLKGLADRYAFSKTTTKLQPATDKMFAMKFDMEKKKFEYEQGKDHMSQMIEMAKNGLKWDVDAFGNPAVVQDPAARQAFGHLSSSSANGGKVGPYDGLGGFNSSGGEDKFEITNDYINSRTTELANQKDQLEIEYAQHLGWKKDQKNLKISDLKPGGNLTNELTPEAKAALQYAETALDMSTKGFKINFDKIDPDFRAFYANHQEKQKEIEALREFRGMAEQQVKDSYGITDEDNKKLVKQSELERQLQEVSAKYPVVANGHGKNTTMSRTNQLQYEQESAPIRNQIAQLGAATNQKYKSYLDNREKETDKLLKEASKSFQMPNLIINDDKKDQVAKMLAGNVLQGNLHAYDTQTMEVMDKIKELDYKNIDALQASYRKINGVFTPTVDIRYESKDKNGKSAGSKTLTIPLDSSQADAFGFGTDMQPNGGYGMALRMTGKVKGLVTTKGSDFNLKYDIIKQNPTKDGDPSVWVKIYNKYGDAILLDKKVLPSYQYAINFVENLTSNKDYDAMMDNIKQYESK